MVGIKPRFSGFSACWNIFNPVATAPTFDQIRISLASPEKIRSWSFGEIKKRVGDLPLIADDVTVGMSAAQKQGVVYGNAHALYGLVGAPATFVCSPEAVAAKRKARAEQQQHSGNRRHLGLALFAALLAGCATSQAPSAPAALPTYADAEPLGAAMEGWAYPYPVQTLQFEQEGRLLRMAQG